MPRFVFFCRDFFFLPRFFFLFPPRFFFFAEFFFLRRLFFFFCRDLFIYFFFYLFFFLAEVFFSATILSGPLVFFFFFSATILSGPYLWKRYSQRLQIECAAWSCGLILHCCLPSNSLRYFFFRHDFVQRRVFHLWGIAPRSHTGRPRTCLVIIIIIIISDPRRGCYMGLSTFIFLFSFIFFFRHDFVRAISLEPLLAETPNLVCYLVLWSNCALLLTIQFALLFFFFFPPRFCPGHISGTVTHRDSKLSVLLGPAV